MPYLCPLSVIPGLDLTDCCGGDAESDDTESDDSERSCNLREDDLLPLVPRDVYTPLDHEKTEGDPTPATLDLPPHASEAQPTSYLEEGQIEEPVDDPALEGDQRAGA